MPVIETYSSKTSPELRNASASDFSNTTGLNAIASSSKELGAAQMGTALYLEKLRDDEYKLSAAKALAEGRKYWMAEVQRRQTDVLEGRSSYEGFTDSFNRDYAGWVKENASQFPMSKRGEMEVNYLEMQNGFMGSVMGFEAGQRAEKIKQNYADVIGSVITPIRMARTSGDLTAATIGATDILNKLPGQLGVDAKNDFYKEVLAQRMNLAKTQGEVKDAMDQAASLGGDIQSKLTGHYNTNLDRINTEKKQILNDLTVNGAKLADDGFLPGDFKQTINLALDGMELTPEDAAKLSAITKLIEDRNTYAKEIGVMSNDQFSQFISDKKSAMNNESDPLKRKELVDFIDFAVNLRANRDEALTKDFVTTAFKKDPVIEETYARYKSVLENGGDPINAKSAFNSYVNTIDAYAEKIGWYGNINYLPAADSSSMAADVKSALNKPNGVQTVVDRIEKMRGDYGSRFGSVMQQLVKGEPELAALSLIPRISVNDKRENVNYKKGELVKAISSELSDPKRYADIKVPTYNSSVTNFRNQLINAGMFDEDTHRLSAFNKLHKYYIIKGDSEGTAQSKAFSVAYGDIQSHGRVIYPTVLKDSMAQMMSEASARMVEEKVKPPSLHDPSYKTTEVLKNPQNYVDFINSPDGNGVLAVWSSVDFEGTEPVLRENGKPVIFSWDELKAGLSKAKRPTSEIDGGRAWQTISSY